MKKVNMDVMQRWIAQRITSLLGFEDDIVVGTCVNYLSEEGKLDPKKLQLQLTGFLEKSTGMFMEELWGLLVDAQSSLGGIPSAFLQDKKQEMLQAKEQELKQEEELRRRMAEHQQEMEKAAASIPAGAAATQDVSLSTAPGNLSRPGGRRASRWGVCAAPTPTPAVDDIENTSDRSPDRHKSEPDGEDRRKEKRKSKKGRKKSDRKKHRRSKKTEGSSATKKGSGDEGTSSEEDDEIVDNSANVEESLRQTLLASVASKKERQTGNHSATTLK